MYLRNSWYVAAWDHEVGSGLFPVKMRRGDRAVSQAERGGRSA